MKKSASSLLTAMILSAAAAFGAERDSVPPTIVFQSPAAGVKQLTNDISVSGTAADTAQAPTTPPGGGTPTTVNKSGVRRVEYRIKGQKSWHRAILTSVGEASTTWVFVLKLPKGARTSVSVRAVDRDGNESDTLTREIRRERFTREFQNP